jgi:hypothetical protein
VKDSSKVAESWWQSQAGFVGGWSSQAPGVPWHCLPMQGSGPTQGRTKTKKSKGLLLAMPHGLS